MPASASTGSDAAGGGIGELNLSAISLLAGAREHVRHERGEVRAVRTHPALRRVRRTDWHVEQPLCRLVHQDDVPFLIGDQDGIGDRIDDQIEPMTLVANLRLREAKRAVAFLDLLARPRKVGDVPQDRDDVGTLPLIFRSRAHELEQQIGSLERIDEQQLAPRQIRMRDRARRQRRRKQHVVERDSPPPPFARVLGRRKEFFGMRVRDDQLAFRVGQQDWVGHRVDDAVKQHPLLTEARLRQELTAVQAAHLLRQETVQPHHIGVDLRSA